jgi:hypothetical protein
MSFFLCYTGKNQMEQSELFHLEVPRMDALFLECLVAVQYSWRVVFVCKSPLYNE